MSNNQDQIARRRATQDVIAANRPFFEERMRHYYEEMGLGEWKPRLSAEERAAQKEREAQEKAVAKIKEMAKKAGIGVVLVEDPDIETKVESVVNGTAEPGVTVDWDKDSTAERVAQVATDAEEFEALSAEEQEARIAEIRDERLAAQADQAVGQG